MFTLKTDNVSMPFVSKYQTDWSRLLVPMPVL